MKEELRLDFWEIKVKFALQDAMKALWQSKGIALLFL
jgi:hypothetical protein